MVLYENEADGIFCPRHLLGKDVTRGHFQVQRFLPAPWLNDLLECVGRRNEFDGFCCRRPRGPWIWNAQSFDCLPIMSVLCNSPTLNLGDEAGFLTLLNSSYTGWKRCGSIIELKSWSFSLVGKSDGLVSRETPFCVSGR